jgi:hypothetical protein
MVSNSRRSEASGVSSLKRAKTRSLSSMDVQYGEVRRHFGTAEILGGRSTIRRNEKLLRQSHY